MSRVQDQREERRLVHHRPFHQLRHRDLAADGAPAGALDPARDRHALPIVGVIGLILVDGQRGPRRIEDLGRNHLRRDLNRKNRSQRSLDSFMSQIGFARIVRRWREEILESRVAFPSPRRVRSAARVRYTLYSGRTI